MSEDYLRREQAALPRVVYESEYENNFRPPAGALLSEELIDSMFSDTVRPVVFD